MLKHSKLTQYQIKKIIRHFCADIDATKTALLLGFNRNTVNRYYSLFRQAVYTQRQREFVALSGAVEVDESYFGATRPRGVVGPRKRGRGTTKQPVFGILERNGQVYTEIISDCSKKTLQQIIVGKISLETVIHSDGWRGYNGLVDVGYDKHLRVNHSKEYSGGKGCHINGIESFWSFTKRRLAKFNGVKANFHLHLKECEWRWNKSQHEMETDLWRILKQFD
jgi:transposase